MITERTITRSLWQIWNATKSKAHWFVNMLAKKWKNSFVFNKKKGDRGIKMYFIHMRFGLQQYLSHLLVFVSYKGYKRIATLEDK